MRRIRVKDLPERGNGEGVSLYCRTCGEHYSPDRGDYFMADPNTILKCHGPLVLVRRETRLIEVNP